MTGQRHQRRSCAVRYPRRASIVRVGLAILSVVSSAARAQDARTVTEPKRPAACTVLKAELAPVADTTLAESDEGRLDTKRIQAALDACRRGEAVVLKPVGAARAFLIG